MASQRSVLSHTSTRSQSPALKHNSWTLSEEQLFPRPRRPACTRRSSATNRAPRRKFSPSWRKQPKPGACPSLPRRGAGNSPRQAPVAGEAPAAPPGRARRFPGPLAHRRGMPLLLLLLAARLPLGQLAGGQAPPLEEGHRAHTMREGRGDPHSPCGPTRRPPPAPHSPSPHG